MNLVTFKWKWGEDELPIVNHYTYVPFGLDTSNDCSWDAHIHSKSNRKGHKAHVGKMDAILTVSHFDTRMKSDRRFGGMNDAMDCPTNVEY